MSEDGRQEPRKLNLVRRSKRPARATAPEDPALERKRKRMREYMRQYRKKKP